MQERLDARAAGLENRGRDQVPETNVTLFCKLHPAKHPPSRGPSTS